MDRNLVINSLSLAQYLFNSFLSLNIHSYFISLSFSRLLLLYALSFTHIYHQSTHAMCAESLSFMNETPKSSIHCFAKLAKYSFILFQNVRGLCARRLAILRTPDNSPASIEYSEINSRPRETGSATLLQLVGNCE